jgi:hypothetical protein
MTAETETVERVNMQQACTTAAAVMDRSSVAANLWSHWPLFWE